MSTPSTGSSAATPQSLIPAGEAGTILRVAFTRLHPGSMVRNPVMFVVWVGTLVCLIVAAEQISRRVSPAFSLANALILFATVVFSNLAESVAEARGKAQASSLRSSRGDTTARRLQDGRAELVSSRDLRAGDLVEVIEGDLIPGDGEIIEGLASIDESAITGESAPVIREAGTDHSGVTGGTRVLSDRIVVRISVNPGDSFLDRMIQLVEGASRQKTPNEIALAILLAALSLIFLIVVVTLPFFAGSLGIAVDPVTLVALLVCLIPTTIGGLLPAIGIAGMDRALRSRVLARSGRAVEVAGDVDTLLLDKTGTITIGNRTATDFLPLPGIKDNRLGRSAAMASIGDATPEGKSIVTLAEKLFGLEQGVEVAEQIEFSAQTRMSGIDTQGGMRIRKGASDRMATWIREQGGQVPRELDDLVQRVASRGATPLVVAENSTLLGVVALSDIVKPNIRERFARLRAMGIETIMVTGDNPLTAAAIAAEAGVDGFVAEAKPEDKLRLIREKQASGRLVAMMGDGTNDAPALAQADVGVAMNSGTQAAREAANMIDLDSDPTKLLDVIEIGKQLLMTRGALTTFSVANDVAKYFAIVPALFVSSLPGLQVLDVMKLGSPASAILSAVIFNAVIIPMLIPIAVRGVKWTPMSADQMLTRNMMIYGLGGLVAPFVGIKAIDLLLSMFGMP